MNERHAPIPSALLTKSRGNERDVKGSVELGKLSSMTHVDPPRPGCVSEACASWGRKDPRPFGRCGRPSPSLRCERATFGCTALNSIVLCHAACWEAISRGVRSNGGTLVSGFRGPLRQMMLRFDQTNQRWWLAGRRLASCVAARIAPLMCYRIRPHIIKCAVEDASEQVGQNLKGPNIRKEKGEERTNYRMVFRRKRPLQ